MWCGSPPGPACALSTASEDGCGHCRHDEHSRALAQSLQSNIRTALAALGRPSPDRGAIDDSAGSEAADGGLVLLGGRSPGYIDEPSAMPGALVEPLFITNPGDLTAVSSSNGLVTLADAIPTGVEEYLAGSVRR